MTDAELLAKLQRLSLIRHGAAFTYTNHRGETARRRVVNLVLRYGTSEYHHELQWLVDGYDLDRQERRTFAVKDITLESGT